MCPLEYSSSINLTQFLIKVEDIFNITKINENGLTLALVFIGIILLLMSSFFSSSETAFSTVNVMRLRTYALDKKKGARKALWIAENYDRAVTTILVGNNFVNIAATTLATIAFGIVITNPTAANILNTIIMTVIVLTFGEILPNFFAKENAERFTLAFSGILYFLIKLLFPIVIIFIGIKKLLLKKKDEDEQPTVTEEELESIIDTMEEEGVIDKDDASLIQSVLDIGERTVNDIMIPRIDFIAVENTSSIEEIKRIFIEYKFSRLPVYKEDKDHIIGILSEKDFFAAILETPNRVNINRLMQTPLYVSETMKVDDLIRKMQKAKKHLAIVSDEYGGTSGIVTMEDALEELVGEIYDEHDDTNIQEDIKKLSDTSFEISADVMLDELYEVLELGQVPETNYPTVGGYLYGMFEHIPVVGDKFSILTTKFVDSDSDGLLEERIYTLEYTILSVVERRIISVQLDIVQPNVEDAKDEKHSKDEDSSNEHNISEKDIEETK